MPVSLFSLLKTPITGGLGSFTVSDTAAPQHVPIGGYKVWDSFSSDLRRFLSTLYSQPDSAPVFTDPRPPNASGITSQEAASANLYASLVIPIQELSAEYQRRFEAGGPLHLSHQESALVMYGDACKDGSLASHPSSEDALKGYFVLGPDELLRGLTSAGIGGGCDDGHKCFRQAAGHVYYNEWSRSGYACVTSLEQTFFCKLTRENVLLVSDVVHARAPHGGHTFLESLFFFMHLVFGEHSIWYGLSAGPSTGEEMPEDGSVLFEEEGRASALHERWVVGVRKIVIKVCRSLNFNFKVIDSFVSFQLLELDFIDPNHRIHRGEKCSVYRGDFNGKKVIVKAGHSDLEKAVREVWMMHKLKDLQGDVIPHLYAAGFTRSVGRGWVTIMQDIGGTSIDKDRERLRPYLPAAKSALGAMHRANVVHGRVAESNIIVGEGGKVMWIDLAAARVHDTDNDADEFFESSQRDQEKMAALAAAA